MKRTNAFYSFFSTSFLIQNECYDALAFWCFCIHSHILSMWCWFIYVHYTLEPESVWYVFLSAPTHTYSDRQTDSVKDKLSTEEIKIQFHTFDVASFVLLPVIFYSFAFVWHAEDACKMCIQQLNITIIISICMWQRISTHAKVTTTTTKSQTRKSSFFRWNFPLFLFFFSLLCGSRMACIQPVKKSSVWMQSKPHGEAELSWAAPVQIVSFARVILIIRYSDIKHDNVVMM